MPLQDIFEETGDIQELIAMGEAKAYARGYTKEYAKMYARDYAQGNIEAAREALQLVLQTRFPDIDVSWVDLSSIENTRLLRLVLAKAVLAQDPGEVFVALGRALYDQKASLAK